MHRGGQAVQVVIDDTYMLRGATGCTCMYFAGSPVWGRWQCQCHDRSTCTDYIPSERTERTYGLPRPAMSHRPTDYSISPVCLVDGRPELPDATRSCQNLDLGRGVVSLKLGFTSRSSDRPQSARLLAAKRVLRLTEEGRPGAWLFAVGEGSVRHGTFLSSLLFELATIRFPPVLMRQAPSSAAVARRNKSVL